MKAGLATLRNVSWQAARPRRFFVMAKKVRRRFADRSGSLSTCENISWIHENLSDLGVLAGDLDATLWSEAQERCAEIEVQARVALSAIPYDLGGGGAYPILYFLTRYVAPTVVVETGVAAGFSSCAFLAALEANGSGILYSSDFPYFRLPNPERYVGAVVPESLKKMWALYLDGDEANLPKILNEVKDPVGLFHYDSDKSYLGREFAMTQIEAHLHRRAVVLMDDIQDNSFFHDYVEQKAAGRPWWIFEFGRKYVGMLGMPCRIAAGG